MKRRNFIRNAALLPASAFAARARNSSRVSPAFPIRQRLDQGPFDVGQDEGWQTILFTTPSEKPLRNPGLGLVGYTWEENGPSIAAREGRETLEEHVERLAALPFVDVLYIRCDWRNVQKKPGQLDLDPVWELTFDAAKRHGLRVAFRIQMSNPEFEPDQIALPGFLRDHVPLVKIGHKQRHGKLTEYVEPRYDDERFQKAFVELNQLLADKFDSHPLMEWVDLMMYGFWGEGHTSNLPNPIHDHQKAQDTFVRMAEQQLDLWKRTPLAVNTQPDISDVGNDAVLDLAMRRGAWLRTDSIFDEEPIQIDEIANRPPWLGAIWEDGDLRAYDVGAVRIDAAGVNGMENRMLHVLDVRGNYWSLWTESANLARYNERYPRGFERLRTQIGYRVRPSWVWQRKRYGTAELIVAISNRGVAGVPGILWLELKSPDGRVQLRGALDPGCPESNGTRQCSFLLPHGYIGPVHLSTQLEKRPDVFRPVAWSCEQPVNADGSITIQVRDEHDQSWRKGI